MHDVCKAATHQLRRAFGGLRGVGQWELNQNSSVDMEPSASITVQAIRVMIHCS